ncbi:uncharacterized protein LOC125198936 [Salvia hispanica]|uniref:uncharacterized protein LOC125198936 n=1 Tax=Salvia hispanica TaxID=49212 RepID=UPI002009BD07|nr:uncharacterized protein LOC125198936 [Salvia hispanica]
MDPNSVATWDAMVELFLEKYYPPSEVLKRQAEVISYAMQPQENIQEAWKRFKYLMKRCPNHGLSSGQQIITFYRGATPEAVHELNMSAGGLLLRLGEDESLKVIERVASNDEGWKNEISKTYRVASTSDIDRMDMMSKQLDFLTGKLGFMGTEPTGLESEDVNYVHQGGNNRNFNNYRQNQGGGNFKNFGNMAHPNLSYGNPNNALQPPPGFQVSNGQVIETKKNELGDVLMEFMKQTGECMANSDKRLKQVETEVQDLSIHMKSLDNQMSQIAQSVSKLHTPGQFPGQPIVNPKDCKAIHLRSGRNYEGPSMLETAVKKEVEAKEVPEEEKEEEEIEAESPNMPSEVQPEAIVLPKPKEVKIPFPQVAQKKKLDEKFVKFLEIFKRVHLNIPLIEALQQMPGYPKFLKEIMSKKKKLVDYETVSLTENCSAIIQQKMPAKMKDPGSFNISCVIGNDRQTKALCDLGASINLMTLSFFRKLKFGVLKPTTITLQMADKSVKFPNGVLENV